MKLTTQDNPNGATDSMEFSKYLGSLRKTAQASWDRWPEAGGMRASLFATGKKIGLSVDQIAYDLDYVEIDCTGGQW